VQGVHGSQEYIGSCVIKLSAFPSLARCDLKFSIMSNFKYRYGVLGVRHVEGHCKHHSSATRSYVEHHFILENVDNIPELDTGEQG
jgi:hypothetical protein